jgi:hypothetical protein
MRDPGPPKEVQSLRYGVRCPPELGKRAPGDRSCHTEQGGGSRDPCHEGDRALQAGSRLVASSAQQVAAAAGQGGRKQGFSPDKTPPASARGAA